MRTNDLVVNKPALKMAKSEGEWMPIVHGDADTGCSMGEKREVKRIIALKRRHCDGELLALVCDENDTYRLERTSVLQKTCPQVCRFFSLN
uniref:Uncharacterized protein n=1 Tax=Parascaris equorum TaxID=6256 RepID=A0A914S4E0_PAREQ